MMALPSPEDSCVCVANRFFSTKGRILQSSSLSLSCGLPGPLSSPVHSVFLRIYQIVVLAPPKVCAISEIFLLFFQSNYGFLHSRWHIHGLDSVSSIQTAAKYQFNTWNLLHTWDLLHLCLCNNGTDHNMPWNWLSGSCPNNFEPLKMLVLWVDGCNS